MPSCRQPAEAHNFKVEARGVARVAKATPILSKKKIIIMRQKQLILFTTIAHYTVLKSFNGEETPRMSYDATNPPI